MMDPELLKTLHEIELGIRAIAKELKEIRKVLNAGKDDGK